MRGSKRGPHKCFKTLTERLTPKYVCPSKGKGGVTALSTMALRPERVKELEAAGEVRRPPKQERELESNPIAALDRKEKQREQRHLIRLNNHPDTMHADEPQEATAKKPDTLHYEVDEEVEEVEKAFKKALDAMCEEFINQALTTPLSSVYKSLCFVTDLNKSTPTYPGGAGPYSDPKKKAKRAQQQENFDNYQDVDKELDKGGKAWIVRFQEHERADNFPESNRRLPKGIQPLTSKELKRFAKTVYEYPRFGKLSENQQRHLDDAAKQGIGHIIATAGGGGDSPREKLARKQLAVGRLSQQHQRQLASLEIMIPQLKSKKGKELLDPSKHLSSRKNVSWANTAAMLARRQKEGSGRAISVAGPVEILTAAGPAARLLRGVIVAGTKRLLGSAAVQHASKKAIRHALAGTVALTPVSQSAIKHQITKVAARTPVTEVAKRGTRAAADVRKKIPPRHPAPARVDKPSSAAAKRVKTPPPKGAEASSAAKTTKEALLTGATVGAGHTLSQKGGQTLVRDEPAATSVPTSAPPVPKPPPRSKRAKAATAKRRKEDEESQRPEHLASRP